MTPYVVGGLLLLAAALVLAWKAGNRFGVVFRGLRSERTRIVDECRDACDECVEVRQADVKAGDDAKIRGLRRRARRKRGPYSAAQLDRERT
jgi:hypothetical protein